MELEIIILSEVSQTMTNISLTLKKKKGEIQMNLFTKQKKTHRHRKKSMVTKGERGGGDKSGVWD